MKKVFQTVIDSKNGNCAQAAIASLFEVDIEDVPNFVDYGKAYLYRLMSYFEGQGYPDANNISGQQHEYHSVLEAAELDGGIDGFFYASVPSQTYENCSHAVIIDQTLTVVHDPSPNAKAIGLGPFHIQSILFPRGVIISKSGNVQLMRDYLNDQKTIS